MASCLRARALFRHALACSHIISYCKTAIPGISTTLARYMVSCSCLLRARNLHLDGRKAARQAIAEAHEAGAKIGAFFCESVLSCGGQVCAQTCLPRGMHSLQRYAMVLLLIIWKMLLWYWAHVQGGYGRMALPALTHDDQRAL